MANIKKEYAAPKLKKMVMRIVSNPANGWTFHPEPLM